MGVPDPRVGNLQIDGCMHPSKEKSKRRKEMKKEELRGSYGTVLEDCTVQYRTVLH